MDTKVAAVLRGFVALTPNERNEFVRVVNEYMQGNQTTRDRLVNESRRDWGITKVDLGPTARACPYCGR